MYLVIVKSKGSIRLTYEDDTDRAPLGGLIRPTIKIHHCAVCFEQGVHCPGHGYERNTPAQWVRSVRMLLESHFQLSISGLQFL